ncbi:autotransporter outer membrane beta-barrel domain-containing protein [Bordetella genomosp. 6]|uniref:autotransporter outer membrane beta-barrel domain-containing protein n=1 Tax=Bordetella genomosp. 6 TaxID=463024 RepID=UPI0024490108|nr:autotransporter outer membrane beta-barrel domain-containing protein [Bordetella genomosp. 6]
MGSPESAGAAHSPSDKTAPAGGGQGKGPGGGTGGVGGSPVPGGGGGGSVPSGAVGGDSPPNPPSTGGKPSGGPGDAGGSAVPPAQGGKPEHPGSDGQPPAERGKPGGGDQPPQKDAGKANGQAPDGAMAPVPPRDGEAGAKPPGGGAGPDRPEGGGGDGAAPNPPEAGGNGPRPPAGNDDAGPQPPQGDGEQGDGEQDAPGAPPVAPAPPAGNGVYDPGTHTLSTPAAAAVGLASSSHGLWQAEMNALSKRMGELRLTPAAGGVWGRAFGRRQDVDNRVAREFRQTISGFELGADTVLPVAEGRWHIGAVAGYTNGRIKFERGGSGDDDSVHVGAYATYIEDGGFYMDGIVRVSRIRHEFKVDDAQGRRVRGRYRGNGVGASLELGKRFTWPSAWYVEPQLEVAAFHAQGADYTASNGLRIKDDGTNSMLGRLGLHVGRQFDLGDGRVVQPYMKLSWVQEFDGKGTVRTNDIRHKVRLDGGRAELAVGVASQLGKHGSLFGSYEYAKGSRQTMPWTFHVGYRYTW